VKEVSPRAPWNQEEDRMIECGSCEGSGIVEIGYPYYEAADCFRCGGKGQVADERTAEECKHDEE
jgi:DnaJ-class molecular chaperone